MTPPIRCLFPAAELIHPRPSTLANVILLYEKVPLSFHLYQVAAGRVCIRDKDGRLPSGDRPLRGKWATGSSHSFDLCAQRLKLDLDPLIAPVYLVDVLDDAFSRSAQSSDEQRHPGPDVGTEERFPL